MPIQRKDINDLILIIQNLYLADSIPWMIGYSGGKDSTAAAMLVWMAVSSLPKDQRTKPVYIMNTNTLVESPVIVEWVERSLKKMEERIQRDSLPFIVRRLIPSFDNTFWVNFLGRGYPYPRKKFRWCTDRLKIRPVNDFIKSKISEHGEVILVLGTRKAESSQRAHHMERLEGKRVRELLSPNPTLANELVFSPMENWKDEDVWAFLMAYPNPWGFPNQDLLTLYRGATADQECPIMTEKDMPSCGKSRFGCWVCTMVEKDRSMEAMITNDMEKAWLTPLLKFRNDFAADEAEDRELRDFRRSRGNLQGGKQRLYHGPYKKEVREKRLEELLRIQQQIQNTAPDAFRDYQLITIEELRNIRRIWVYEKHEFEDSLPEIYYRVTGQSFDDPTWNYPSNYGKEEWKILEETCKDLYPHEELLLNGLSSLIDLENRAIFHNDRSGLLNELDTVICKTFYQNEEDALGFYKKMQERKASLGAKHDESFLGDELAQQLYQLDSKQLCLILEDPAGSYRPEGTIQPRLQETYYSKNSEMDPDDEEFEDLEEEE